jgi:hypothetical protein
MKMKMAALALAAICCCVNRPVAATTFAVLFDQTPDDSDECLVVNPTYEPPTRGGENPLYEAKSLLLKPAQLYPGYPVFLTVGIDEPLPAVQRGLPKNAWVFSATLTDAATGDEIHKFASPIEICFDMGEDVTENFALGYLNESIGAWQEIQGRMEKKGGGLYCGTTDHFTHFYIAAVPEPGAGLLATVGAVAWGVKRKRKGVVAPGAPAGWQPAAGAGR